MSGVTPYIPDTRDKIKHFHTMSALFPYLFRRAITPDMSDTQFSALDWRPSRKRASHPRVRSWGGQKQAPAALLAAGKNYGFAHARKCDHCGRVAMREATVCRWHGGGKIAAQSRPYVRPLRAIERNAAKTVAQAAPD
jgi:hypothetical protein